MQPQRRSTLPLLLAGLAAGACTEQTPPTAVPYGVNAAVTAAAGPNNQKVKVKTMQLSSNTLRIDGPSVSGQVSIGNSGLAIPANVVVRAEVTQGAASRQAVNTPTQCSPAPEDAGKLPTGTCDMTFTASVSNLIAGPGTLAPGSATFVLHVIQTSDAGDTELASKSLLVNLVATPSMTVTLAPTTLVIGGGAATATAVIQNPANSLQGVLLQGWIVQGTAPNQARRASGGALVTCGSNTGVLPPGTCTMTVSASASNTASGTGTLVPGAATFELQLIQSSGSSSTTFDVKTVAITLVGSGAPTITGITIAPYVVVGSGSTPYTAIIQNNGPSVSTVVLQTSITQGAVTVASGGRQVQCNGGPVGELPTGTCTVLADVAVSNGSGLVPGPATLEIDLDQQVGGVTTNFDKKFIAITLVASTPSIVSIELSAPNVLIGEQIEYTATLYNPTSETISAAGIQGYLSQGTIEDFGAGGTDVVGCGGQAELPPGVCRVTFTLNTRNIFETPEWQPGAATFRLELTQGVTLLDSKSVTVFLNIIQ
jgi:hypothetical protein